MPIGASLRLNWFVGCSSSASVVYLDIGFQKKYTEGMVNQLIILSPTADREKMRMERWQLDGDGLEILSPVRLLFMVKSGGLVWFLASLRS